MRCMSGKEIWQNKTAAISERRWERQWTHTSMREWTRALRSACAIRPEAMMMMSSQRSLSLFCLYSEVPPCADLRIDSRVFVSAAASPISVILLLAFWSILWKKEERDYLESKLIIDALLCFVDRFLYAIRTHTGSGSEIFFSGFWNTHIFQGSRVLQRGVLFLQPCSSASARGHRERERERFNLKQMQHQWFLVEKASQILSSLIALVLPKLWRYVKLLHNWAKSGPAFQQVSSATHTLQPSRMSPHATITPTGFLVSIAWNTMAGNLLKL